MGSPRRHNTKRPGRAEPFAALKSGPGHFYYNMQKLEIGGLPADLWKNRRVRVDNVHESRQHKVGGMLLGTRGQNFLVKIDKHKEPQLVESHRVHPHWSLSPDLKAMKDKKLGLNNTAGADDADKPVTVTSAPGPGVDDIMALTAKEDRGDPSAEPAEPEDDREKVLAAFRERFRIKFEGDLLGNFADIENACYRHSKQLMKLDAHRSRMQQIKDELTAAEEDLDKILVECRDVMEDFQILDVTLVSKTDGRDVTRLAGEQEAAQEEGGEDTGAVTPPEGQLDDVKYSGVCRGLQEAMLDVQARSGARLLNTMIRHMETGKVYPPRQVVHWVYPLKEICPKPNAAEKRFIEKLTTRVLGGIQNLKTSKKNKAMFNTALQLVKVPGKLGAQLKLKE